MTQRIPQREVNLARELSKAGLKLIQFSNELLAQDAAKRPNTQPEIQSIRDTTLELLAYVTNYLTKYGRRV